MADKTLPSDYGMPLAECSWVSGARHLQMKCRKSFDLRRRTDKTDSNTSNKFIDSDLFNKEP